MELVTCVFVGIICFWIGHMIGGWITENKKEDQLDELESKANRILYILEVLQTEIEREQEQGSVPFGPNIKLHKEWNTITEYRNKKFQEACEQMMIEYEKV